MMLVGLSAHAKCPEGDVTITNQDEANQFLIDYPNCTEIAGDLRLTTVSSPEITDLSPLANITSVLGALRLENLGFYNEELEQFIGPSLEPLENITSVGHLYIGASEMNSSPPNHYNDLSPLNNIAGSIGDFFITKAFVWSPLPDFPLIESIDYFRMAGVSSVTTTPSFPALTHVRDFTVQQSTFAPNDMIQTLIIPANLQTVSADQNPDTEFGGLYIFRLPMLEEVVGGDALTSIDGEVYFGELPALQNMDGLNQVTFAKTIEMNLCQQAPFDAFPNLQEAESILLRLQTLDDECEPLSDTAVLISFGANAPEVNVTGDNGLDLELYGTEEISLSGNFHTLGQLKIVTPSVSTISGLGEVAEIAGDMFFNTPSLLALPTFSSLESIGGQLRLIPSPGIPWELPNLSGLENLTSLGSLRIAPPGPPLDHAIASLAGLEGLSSVNGEIRLRNLPNLSSVDAISDELEFNANLILEDLPMLESCDASSTLCHLLASAEEVSLGGNGESCNDLAEILSVCALSSNDNAAPQSPVVRLFFDDRAQLLGQASEEGPYTISVFDQGGKLLFDQTLQLNQAPSPVPLPHSLQRGLYIARWTKEGRSGSEKLLQVR